MHIERMTLVGKYMTREGVLLNVVRIEDTARFLTAGMKDYETVVVGESFKTEAGQGVSLSPDNEICHVMTLSGRALLHKV